MYTVIIMEVHSLTGEKNEKLLLVIAIITMKTTIETGSFDQY